MSLTEFRYPWNPIDILRSGRPFIENFKYDPDEPVKITLIDRQTGEIGGEWTGAPGGFCFHHVNAFEQDGEGGADLCRFDDAQIVEALYVDKSRAGVGQNWPSLHRYRLAAGNPVAIAEPICAE